MKNYFKTLLVAALTIASSVSATAQSSNLQAELVSGEEYYLYSVGHGLFVNGAGAFDTQAILSSTPMKVKMEETDGKWTIYRQEKPISGSAKDQYYFKRETAAGADMIFVDGNVTQEIKWKITDMGEHQYKIQAPDAAGEEDACMGVRSDLKNTQTKSCVYGPYFNQSYSEKDCLWAFVKAEDYTEDMKPLIAKTAIRYATATAPYDFNYMLKSPSCDNINGWALDGTLTNRSDLLKSKTNTGFSGKCIEYWKYGTSSDEGKMFYRISSLPAGTYRLTAKVFENHELSDSDIRPDFFFGDTRFEFSEPITTATEKVFYTQHKADGDLDFGFTLPVGKIWVIIDDLKLEAVGGPNAILTNVEDNATYSGNVVTAGNTCKNYELLAAYKRIYELIDEGRRSQMKPGDDATSLVLNADFTESTADVPYSGLGNWTITGTNNFASNGKPNTQSGVAEVWVNAFELSQKVEGLQNGVYKLSTNAFYRYPEKNGDPYADYVAGNVKDVEIASLFINDSEQGIPNVFSGRQTTSLGVNERPDNDGGYTPNDKAAAAKYFENGLYAVEVYGVVTDGTMTLGIHGKNDNHWVLWGAFKLEFEGKDAKVLTDVLGKAIAEYGSLAEQPQGNGPKSALVATLDEARTALSSGNGDAMFAAYTKLMNDAKESKTSIDAYADLVVANGVLATTIDLYQDDADATLLSEAIALNSAVTTALNNGTYGNEEAMAKVAEVRKAIVTLKASAANDENPVDMTEVIVNPDFANNNADGWTVDAGTAKCGVQNTVFEGYSGAFDIHQVITGVPQGTYKISAKGFYRRGSSENANNCYLNDTTIIAASLYGNGADSIAMQNIVYVDDIAQNAGTGSWKSITINDAEYFYPNDRATARNRFDNELYENELFTCVGEDGILVIGMRNTNPLAEDWAAVSNFRLTCYGKNSKYAESTGISDINAVDAKTVEIYNVNGMRVNAPVKGINILKIEANGKTVTKKVVIK